MRTLPVALVAVVLIAGCGGSGGEPDLAPVTSCEVQFRDPANAVRIVPLRPGRDYRINFETTHGTFVVEIDEETAPCNGYSLMKLAQDGFYNGLRIHRIVPDFVIQAGRSPKTQDGGPGYFTIDTILPDTAYTKGVVAMARASVEPRGAGGSEFFIVTGSDTMLPPDYAHVGKVVDGMDVVERIGELGDAQERPTERIVIKNAKPLVYE